MVKALLEYQRPAVISGSLMYRFAVVSTVPSARRSRNSTRLSDSRRARICAVTVAGGAGFVTVRLSVWVAVSCG